jgi:hypothetical protein
VGALIVLSRSAAPGDASGSCGCAAACFLHCSAIAAICAADAPQSPPGPQAFEPRRATSITGWSPAADRDPPRPAA